MKDFHLILAVVKTIDPPIPMYFDQTKSIPDDGLYLFVLMGYYYKHETDNPKNYAAGISFASTILESARSTR